MSFGISEMLLPGPTRKPVGEAWTECPPVRLPRSYLSVENPLSAVGKIENKAGMSFGFNTKTLRVLSEGPSTTAGDGIAARSGF